MKIAVLSIGDELMYGEIADTNFPHIAASLYDAGLKVVTHLTVGDDELGITAALSFLAQEHEAVIVTGGLGPTSDDRTGAAAAAAAGRRLIMNGEALAHIRKIAGRLGGDLPPANEKQALIPEGAALIANPLGTACGFRIPVGACRFFFLPGVPAEMSRMFHDSVLPALLASRSGRNCYQTRVLKVFGPSEAEVETLLAEVVLPPGVTLAFLVECPEIQVKLRGSGEEAGAVNAALDVAAQEVRTRLGTAVFAEENDDMDAVVARLLREKGLTLSLAESCTGGLVAKRVTDLPGSSAYFLAGAVTYANAAKTAMLGVSAGLLATYGAVSAEVAAAMATGSRKRTGSDLAVSITGIAGPEGGTVEKPVGTVFIAIAHDAGTEVEHFLFHGDREEIRHMTAFTALDRLRRMLLQT